MAETIIKHTIFSLKKDNETIYGFANVILNENSMETLNHWKLNTKKKNLPSLC